MKLGVAIEANWGAPLASMVCEDLSEVTVFDLNDAVE